ncbi:hypothetical protein RRG08_050280 [Elysia crispata]|uniref:Uncharacterized protein n=1 Tax=Elysia crispata TaxID=231223 RepID=A0AAE1E960_9GAST|nr:hypothetical protein RRG08_050280 [Elysia crispata]
MRSAQITANLSITLTCLALLHGLGLIVFYLHQPDQRLRCEALKMCQQKQKLFILFHESPDHVLSFKSLTHTPKWNSSQQASKPRVPTRDVS